MRRENRKINRKNTNDKVITYGLLGTAVLVIAIIAIMTYGDIKSNSNKYANLEKNKMNNISNDIGNTQSASTQIGKTVNEVENQNVTNTSNETNTMGDSNKINTNEIANAINKITQNLNKTKNTTTKATATTTTTNENKGPSFIKPVQGDISKEFAKDQLIYSNTLEEWTTHMGIDIKAEEGTEVVATENGTIKSIKNDPRYGFVITIEHENGYQSVYSNLQTSEDVVEGEKVEKGQIIATVGRTAAFEAKEEPHLHFELLKDYEQVNPQELIK